jgi:hypothetical protein
MGFLTSLSDSVRASVRRVLRRTGLVKRRPALLVRFPPYALK